MFEKTQRSITGPLLFKNFSADLLAMHGNIEIESLADDNTPYSSAKENWYVIESLKKASVPLFIWFKLNILKSNVNKCYFLQALFSNVDNFTIKNSECEKLLGVKFDSKLTFDQQMLDACKRTSRRVNALARVTTYMILPKRRLLMSSLFKVHFNHCPLI